MAANAFVRARIDEDLKNQAARVKRHCRLIYASLIN